MIRLPSVQSSDATGECESPSRTGTGAAAVGLLRAQALRDRQGDRELDPSPGSDSTDFAPVLLDDLLGDEEPQAGAQVRGPLFAVEADEFLEELREVVGGEPLPSFHTTR